MINFKEIASKSLQTAIPVGIAIFMSYQVFSVKKIDTLGSIGEQRVIKCILPLAKELDQNVFYVAEDIVSAKKELFNSKKGLYFEGKMYVKTSDFKGNEYVVPFESIDCDSVGYGLTAEQFKTKI